MSAIIITTVPEGHIVDVNDAFTRLFGYARPEMVGKNILKSLWVDERERNRIMKLVSTEGRFNRQEIELQTATGEVKTMLVSGSLIEIEGKECFVTSGLDITERKQLEKTLRDARNELEIRVREKRPNWPIPIRNSYNMRKNLKD